MRNELLRAGACVGAVVVLGGLPAGCVTPENDRITLGQDERIEALTPAPLRPLGPAMAVPVGTMMLQEPSVIDLDRSNWEATVVRAPVDGTAHRQVYSKRMQIARRTARQRGEYPNAETALELTGGSIWQQQAEVPANLGLAALDLLLLAPRILWSHPWQLRWSPDVAHERMWVPERPIFPEPVDLLEDPFAEPPPRPVTP